MGDFNFDYAWSSEKNTRDHAFKYYTDLWETLRDPEEESFTMFKTPKYKEVTFDHVILSKESNFEPYHISRVGNFCCYSYKNDDPKDIAKDAIVRTPSDHLGLYAVIKQK